MGEYVRETFAPFNFEFVKGEEDDLHIYYGLSLPVVVTGVVRSSFRAVVQCDPETYMRTQGNLLFGNK